MSLNTFYFFQKNMITNKNVRIRGLRNEFKCMLKITIYMDSKISVDSQMSYKTFSFFQKYKKTIFWKWGFPLETDTLFRKRFFILAIITFVS